MVKIFVQKVNRAEEGPSISVIVDNKENRRIDQGFDLNPEVAARLASMIQEAIRQDGYRGEIEVGETSSWVEFREQVLLPRDSDKR